APQPLVGQIVADVDASIGEGEHVEPGDSTPYRPADFLDLIGESTGGEGVSEVRHFKGGDYLAVMLPLTQTVNGQTSIWGYILTLSQIPQHTLQKIEKIRGMFEEYKKQSLLKVPVSANYYFTFLLITLLILFSAIWLGFYMARGITVPIRQLAEGTRRVAGGDLNVSIGLETADEIGLLVESFNKMTKDLRENRQRIEQANEDLKFTNIELERRRNYIETVLENIGAGVVSIDKKGRITTFNNGANRILDFPRTDLLGSSYKDALPPAFNDPVRRMIKQMNQAEKGSIQEQVELVVGEINLTLLISLRFMRDPAGRYLGLLIVFEDLTQMIKAQKVAAWQEVAQGIAHEIKNPLTPIQLNTQRLRKKFYEDKGAFALVFDESIDIITQEVEGMKNLLNEFLRFSRMPTPHFKSYSLHKIIEDVIRLYQDNEKNVDIQTRFDPKIQTLNLDPDQIRRVFLNLFDNALDAVDEGGRIEIMTQLNTREGRVKVDFLDNGPGISPQNRDKLFLPHFTTKNRGTGLGLAIVSRIIVDHSGIIRVQDNHPRGTIFIIELPVSSGQTSSRVA
ncbi:MAG: PAS domain-containing sensor histidine kinase, partial [Nitrospinaceae bacterium]